MTTLYPLTCDVSVSTVRDIGSEVYILNNLADSDRRDLVRLDANYKERCLLTMSKIYDQGYYYRMFYDREGQPFSILGVAPTCQEKVWRLCGWTTPLFSKYKVVMSRFFRRTIAKELAVYDISEVVAFSLSDNEVNNSWIRRVTIPYQETKCFLAKQETIIFRWRKDERCVPLQLI